MAARRDVAIYSPGSSVHFAGAGLMANERAELGASAEGIPQGGGAELQMALLSRGLAREGLRTALIVWPIGQPAALLDPTPDLVERPAYTGAGLADNAAEAVHIWRAMSASDAGAYVFRGGGPQLLVGAAFCRLRRRKLVFSAANDLQFDFSRPDRGRVHLTSYRAALRRADLIVAQSRQQAELAVAAGLGPIELIESIAEPAEPASSQSAGPEAFLWIGRLVDYKRPLEFVRLAESLPEVPFRMVWFATDETRPELATELQAAGELLGNLELAGQVPRPELLQLIARSAAVVSTSSAEGMPNTFLEAWSRGVPVVSLDYDPDGRIADLGLGMVAHSGGELREAVASLWRDGARRAELGARAREYVREVHLPERVSKRWAEVLRGVLADP